MFLKPLRVLSVAGAALAMIVAASAQTAPPPHVPLQKTIGAAKPQVVPPHFILNGNTGFILRQDLFDRNNPNNLRSDYHAPPAQPGQF